MKKIIPALVAVAVMSIGLTACGDDEDCEGAGLSSGVGVMSMTDGKSGGATGGSSRSGSRSGTGSGTSKSGKSGGSNGKPSSPKGFKGSDDDCDDD